MPDGIALVYIKLIVAHGDGSVLICNVVSIGRFLDLEHKIKWMRLVRLHLKLGRGIVGKISLKRECTSKLMILSVA